MRIGKRSTTICEVFVGSSLPVRETIRITLAQTYKSVHHFTFERAQEDGPLGVPRYVVTVTH